MLTVKQEKFVQGLFKGLTQREAYKQAYNTENMKDATIDNNAYKLAQTSEIITSLKELQGKQAERVGITADMIIKELAKVAFSDGTDFAKVVEKTGKRTKIDEEGLTELEEFTYKTVDVENTENLSKDKRAAIASIKETKFGIAVETYDKIKALELLGKHLGVFTDKVDMNVTGNLSLDNKLKELNGDDF